MPAGRFGSSLGIDAGRLRCRVNSTCRSRSVGPGDFAEQLGGDRLRRPLAADLPHRAAAERGDRLEHVRLEAAADGDGVQGRVLAFAQPSASRLANASGSASPVVTMPSPT